MPCPLPPHFVNVTGNISLGESIKEETHLQGETDAVAFCTPRYFTLNIQVLTRLGRGSGPVRVVGPP